MEIEIKEKAVEKITNSEDVAKIFKTILNTENEIDQDKEHFWTLGIDNANHIKYIELVSLGILDSSIVHPREVFRMAIIKGVAAIIACHNHPSGQVKPSESDIKTTEKLKAAGEIIGITLLDHVIIGNYKRLNYSFKNDGKL